MVAPNAKNNLNDEFFRLVFRILDFLVEKICSITGSSFFAYFNWALDWVLRSMRFCNDILGYRIFLKNLDKFDDVST